MRGRCWDVAEPALSLADCVLLQMSQAAQRASSMAQCFELHQCGHCCCPRAVLLASHAAFAAALLATPLVVAADTVIGGGGANVGCCGGWLAGSGLSWTTRNNGFGLDNVLQYEVVTADGERKIVDACSEPDLYWALRGGGGGSFGVVTSLYYRAFPTIPVVMVRGTPRVLESSTVRHTGPCLRPPHTPHPCCVHAQMRLSHNGLSSSSLLGSWCWEKVQAAGGTLNASNLPNRSACFPGAEDWVGVIDSWQASPRPAPSPAPCARHTAL